MLRTLFAYAFHLTGFTQPGNLKMVYIGLLYLEMFIIMLFLLISMVLLLDYILFSFSSKHHLVAIKINQDVISLADIIFVVLPTIIVLYMIVPAVGFIYSYDGFQVYTSQSYLNLHITGHQWYWSYELFYDSCSLSLLEDLHLTHAFDSILSSETGAQKHRLLEVDHALILPSGVAINSYITSADVIHSWTIPGLGVKVDAIPGRIQSFTLFSDIDSGTFYGQCSELCGIHHARMPIVLTVVNSNLFEVYLFINSNIDLGESTFL